MIQNEQQKLSDIEKIITILEKTIEEQIVFIRSAEEIKKISEKISETAKIQEDLTKLLSED